jgi:uncharacterized membrane protein YccC
MYPPQTGPYDDRPSSCSTYSGEWAFEEKAINMKWSQGFSSDHWHGVHLAVNVFIATTILWLVLRLASDVNPIWGITSMLSASEPVVKEAAKNFRGSFRNSVVGSAVGLIFVVFGSGNEWALPAALMATVLFSMYVSRVKTMWQQAPIAAAIVIAASLSDKTDIPPYVAGLGRVGEVLFGCAVGLGVSWFMSLVWPSMEP